jgi:hypothetical protein
VIVTLAAVVRFSRLGLFSLGFDEAMSFKRALEPTVAAVWRATFIETPLYNVLLHCWLVLGHDPAVARALSAALSVAALILGWRVLARLLPPVPALAALALFAFSPFQVQYAQEARPYMLTIACEFGAILALLRAIETGKAEAWAAWSACCAVAALSHLLALAWIAASAAFVWGAADAGASRRRVLGWGALAALPALGYAAADARSIARVNLTAPQAFNLPEFLIGIDNFFGPGAWVPAALIVPSLAVFGALMVIGVLVSAMPSRPDARARTLRVAVLAFGLVPLALVLVGNWAGVVYRPKLRYAMGSQLFLLAACARGLWAPPWPAVRALGLGALLALDAASLGAYFGGGFPTLDLPPCKKPFHVVAADLVARSRPGDGILSVGFQTYVPLDWYLGGRLPHGYALRDPLVSDGELRVLGAPVDVAGFVRAHGRVWLVCAPVYYTAPLVVPPEVTAALRRAAVLRGQEVRPGILIQLWDRRR